jgi:hypothetical protein
MIVECTGCESRVDAKILAEYVAGDLDYDKEKFTFLICPVCKNPILGSQIKIFSLEGNLIWSPIERIWPQPDKYFSWSLPTIVRNGLEEAQKCFKATSYRACVVMCGTALEGICVQFTSKKILATGLRELLDKKIIDSRFYEWSEALREHRNLGAHATEENISREDARDLLEFTNAICEYIYDLSAKFEEFKKRQVAKKK